MHDDSQARIERFERERTERIEAALRRFEASMQKPRRTWKRKHGKAKGEKRNDTGGIGNPLELR